ncbi:MAG: CBS domain-containing protein [Phycisphaerales bacterium]|nr:CBS domain-containing protein [Phycisphaerales bacterium]
MRHVPGFGDVMPANFALVGMAGVLAGAVHCPLTAFLLIFELTNDYKLILPVMLVAVLATTIAKLFDRDSIYTVTLREQGIRVGALADLTVLRRMQINPAMVSPVEAMRADTPAQRLLDIAANIGGSEYVVIDKNDHYLGLVRSADLRLALIQKEAIPLMLVEDLARNDVPTLLLGDTLEQVMDKFNREDVGSLPVLDVEKRVLGAVTRAELMKHYLKALEEE